MKDNSEKKQQTHHALALGQRLKELELSRPVTIMEVCGTHTHALFRSGIRDLLPAEIKLLSGPGCPVCVTSPGYIDMALELAGSKDVIITTFGDMMRVPGKNTSLQYAKAEGADIRIVYSPLEVLSLAVENSLKKVVFLAVGFETTTPTVAATVLRAAEAGLTNLTFLTAHKTVPNALRTILNDPAMSIDGFILPGHVSTVTGSDCFQFLSDEYKVGAVIAGFEPLEMLAALLKLAPAAAEGEAILENLYGKLVTRQGNIQAQEIIQKVFMPFDSTWRGIGEIPGTGLLLRPEFASFDSRLVFGLEEENNAGPAGCRCGEILVGKLIPSECFLFGTVCNPERPVGPCMVSSEGTCAAYYKYSC